VIQEIKNHVKIIYNLSFVKLKNIEMAKITKQEFSERILKIQEVLSQKSLDGLMVYGDEYRFSKEEHALFQKKVIQY
jgi:hypothetical protein